MKIICILLAVLVLIECGQLGFQTGSDIASLVRSQSGKYYGQYHVKCVGGRAPYQVTFKNLPSGWTSSGNTLNIPDIINTSNAQFRLEAEVVDADGAIFAGALSIVINGVNVQVQNIGAISATGSSSPSSGSGYTPSSQSVLSLFSSEPGLPAGSNLGQTPNGNFPVSPSPSGPPSSPNIVPTVISNSQAPYNPARDGKVITPEDVKQTAIFNRQLNANKAVANLISIIKQLTANVNAAKADIVTLQDILSRAESANRDCNSQIYSLANTRTQIENAINSRQNQIKDANAQRNDLANMLRDLENTRNTLVNERNTIEKQSSPNAEKVEDLEDDFEKCEDEQSDAQDALDDNEDDISSLQNEIKITQEDLANAPAAIDQINQQIPILDSEIRDLERRLADARNRRNELLSEKAKLQKMIRDASKKIEDLTKQIRELERKRPQLERDLERITKRCQEIRKDLEEIRDDLAEQNQNFNNISEQIKAQDALIQQKKNDIKAIEDSIAGIPNQIITLQAELARVIRALERQYYICNDAAEAVRTAKQNLAAMQLKFNTESVWLKEANVNLEKARAEKELADIAVQEIIASSTDGLPFAIVPNGLGNTNVGTPRGNNPAGNALGPVRERNQIVAGSPAVVGDLKYYLSSAYGAGVDITRPSSVTTLYPLSILTLEALTGRSQSGVFNPDGTFVTANNLSGVAPYGGGSIAQFGCNGSSAIVQGQGKVLGVQAGMIRVQDNNGGVSNLYISGCSKLNSNQKDFTVVPSVDIYYKGQQTTAGINLYEMTCIV